MMSGTVGKQTWLVPIAVGALTLAAVPARGQEPLAKPGEVKAVVRISKRLIDDVAERIEVVAAIPYDAKVLGFRCQGVIDGSGKLAVDLRTGEGEATFIISSHGTAQTYARGVRGPIVAMGPGWGPFASQTLVRFDGRKFALVETVPWAQVHGHLDRVEGRHGGPVGRVVGHMVRPVGQLLVPRAEAQAVPIAEYYLKTFVDELGEKVITRLNKTTAVEVSLNRLYPETRDWIFHLSTDSQFIQAAYGPRGSAAPRLPANPSQIKDVRLELWLHTTTKEAQALAKLTKNPLAKQLVQRYLEATLPELAALTEERAVTAVGDWLVLSIGAPKKE
jgi:hypothetical protein